jgi:hypothetical protein
MPAPSLADNGAGGCDPRCPARRANHESAEVILDRQFRVLAPRLHVLLPGGRTA